MWSMQIMQRTSILSIKDKPQTLCYPHLIRNWTEENKMNRTTIYRGRDRMNLADELDLCDDGNILSNKDKLLRIGKFLGVEAKTWNEIPNIGWNLADREM